MSFQQLYSELESDLQLHYNGKVAHAKDAAIDGMSMTPDMIATQLPKVLSAKVMYQRQGMYAHPKRNLGDYCPSSRSRSGPRGGADGSPRSSGSKSSAQLDPLSLAGCFNCDHPGHTMQDCHEKIDTKRAALRKLEYFRKKHRGHNVAATVLYQLCQQLDAMVGDDGELASLAFIGMVSDDKHVDEAACFKALCMNEEGSTQGQAAPLDDPSDDESPPRRVHFAPGAYVVIAHPDLDERRPPGSRTQLPLSVCFLSGLTPSTLKAPALTLVLPGQSSGSTKPEPLCR